MKAYRYIVEYYIRMEDLEKYPGIHELPKEEITLAEAVFTEEREITENVKAALEKLSGDNAPETPLNDWCAQENNEDDIYLFLSVWGRQDNAATWKLIQEALTLPVEITPCIREIKEEKKG